MRSNESWMSFEFDTRRIENRRSHSGAKQKLLPLVDLAIEEQDSERVQGDDASGSGATCSAGGVSDVQSRSFDGSKTQRGSHDRVRMKGCGYRSDARHPLRRRNQMLRSEITCLSHIQFDASSKLHNAANCAVGLALGKHGDSVLFD